MASIPEHIKNLLFEQDCVVVPDFGGFITNFHGAVVREQDASMLPPRKRVAFNEVLKFDDGLLTSYVALKEGLSREEVRTKIRLFAEQAWQELRQRTIFRFEHLGTFTLNAEGKLVFEPEYRINFYGESYGMTPVVLRSYRRTGAAVAGHMSQSELIGERMGILEVVPVEVEDEAVIPFNSRQRWLTLSNLAASVLLILLSLIGWIWFDGGNSTLSSLNPFSMINYSDWKKKTTASTVEPQTEAALNTKPTLVQDTKILDDTPDVIEATPVVSVVKFAASRGPIRNVLVIPMRIRTAQNETFAKPGRFFVVAGGFGKVANAQRLQKGLQGQGFTKAKLLYPVTSKSRLIRVAAQEYDTAQEARQAAAESRSVLGDHVWVLKTK